MKIILSPAKKMREDDQAGIEYTNMPAFLSDAETVKSWLQEKSYEELKGIWSCNDKIAEQNVQRLKNMNLRKNLTPAILSYDGIAYQYMAPAVFETEMLSYIEEHLRILSGFYGVLRPLDGVRAYRLEMQAKASIRGAGDLYAYWSSRLYEAVRDDSGIIINLASKEYSKCIEKYLRPEDSYITCTFAEKENEKLVQKGVYCKMARGEMVRFMAGRKIEDPEQMKDFNRLGYTYCDALSSPKEYVFLKKECIG